MTWLRNDYVLICCYRIHASGIFGWIAGLLWGASNMLFTAAIQNTAVANVLVIVASNTVFSSIFSYLLLGELIPIRMFITSAICFGAIALIFSGKLHIYDNSFRALHDDQASRRFHYHQRLLTAGCLSRMYPISCIDVSTSHWLDVWVALYKVWLLIANEWEKYHKHWKMSWK